MVLPLRPPAVTASIVTGNMLSMVVIASTAAMPPGMVTAVTATVAMAIVTPLLICPGTVKKLKINPEYYDGSAYTYLARHG